MTATMRVDLSEQVALVTGASRGIGEAIARRLAASGARVVVNHVAPEADNAAALIASIEADGGRARAVEADVTDSRAVATMFADVRRAEGRLDVLVNNAGIVKDGLLATMRDQDFWKVLQVNLGGTAVCCREALRLMMPARYGRIVNLSSIQATRGGRGQANYAASKAGVLAVTRSVALEAGEYGIRANAVLPGFIETDMTARVKRVAGDEVKAAVPVGRLGCPDDVAGLVLFLCSAEADYVTGQGLVVDGGWTIT